MADANPIDSAIAQPCSSFTVATRVGSSSEERLELATPHARRKISCATPHAGQPCAQVRPLLPAV